MSAGAHPYFRDREDLRRAMKLFDDADQMPADSRPAEKLRSKGWALLREVLERHPWKPKRVLKRRPRV